MRGPAEGPLRNMLQCVRSGDECVSNIHDGLECIANGNGESAENEEEG